MNGGRAALDTTQAIGVLNNTENLGEWVQGFGQICLPVPVVGELRFGALKSRHSDDNLRRVMQLVGHCRVLDATYGTAEIYADIRIALKKRGRPIPENDLWIAALCIENDMPLLTTDSHFEEIDGLTLNKT